MPTRKKVILVRMDGWGLGLLLEENDVPYRSATAGTMHACGHDGHVAMGLGTATRLTAQRADIAGNVKTILARLESLEVCPRCGRIVYREDTFAPAPTDPAGDPGAAPTT